MQQNIHKVRCAVIALLLVGSLTAPTLQKYLTTTPDKITIGILQTASHPALDNAREGFIDELKQILGKDVHFVIKNGEGSPAHLHALATLLHEDHTITAIYAIATPAAQAIAHIEKGKPIFIAAVTDPHALNLIQPAGNICGTCDKIVVKDHIRIIKALIPQVKKIGLLYNTGEVNSVGVINEMAEKLKQESIATKKIAVTNEAEIPSALNAHIQNIDMIWVPTDNTIASAISYVAHQALLHKKPLVVSFACNEALCSAGVDYYQAGKKTAQIAKSVLTDHKKPYHISIAEPVIEKITVNKAILHELNLTIQESLRDTVVYV